MSPRARKVFKVVRHLMGAALLAYLGFLAYAMYFWPRFPDLPREVAEVMNSDAIAFVPSTGEKIDVVWRQKPRETMKERATLIAWLCGTSVPRNTSVLFTETEKAQGLLEMRLVRLPRPPITVGCSTSARFYAVRDGLIGTSHE